MLRLKTFNVDVNTENSGLVKEFANKRKSSVQDEDPQVRDPLVICDYFLIYCLPMRTGPPWALFPNSGRCRLYTRPEETRAPRKGIYKGLMMIYYFMDMWLSLQL